MSANPLVGAADLKGLYHYTFTTSLDLVIECYLDYSPAERETRMEPGHPESCSLCHALVNGVDILEVIEELVPVIEEEALQQMSEAAASHKEDAAAEAYERRREEEAY